MEFSKSATNQKKIRICRVLKILKENKDITLRKFLSRLFVYENMSKRTAKDYIEQIVIADLAKIKGEKGSEKLLLTEEGEKLCQ